VPRRAVTGGGEREGGGRAPQPVPVAAAASLPVAVARRLKRARGRRRGRPAVRGGRRRCRGRRWVVSGRRRRGGGCRRRRRRRRSAQRVPSVRRWAATTAGGGRVGHAHSTCGNVCGGGAARVVWWRGAPRRAGAACRVALWRRCYPYLPPGAPQPPPPPPAHEWRCIGVGAAAVAAAVTTTVAAAGTAAPRQRRRGARHETRRAAGGRASVVPACRVRVVFLWRLPCHHVLGLYSILRGFSLRFEPSFIDGGPAQAVFVVTSWRFCGDTKRLNLEGTRKSPTGATVKLRRWHKVAEEPDTLRPGRITALFVDHIYKFDVTLNYFL